MARPTRLYVANDAPREQNEGDASKTAEVREIVQQVDWPCEVKYLFHNDNLGCSLGPRAAFKWFFDQEEEGIILEDDCVPHPSFFSFCEEMLHRYKNDQRIISINGSNLGYTSTNAAAYTFSRFMNMWGWATWKDRASKIDYSLQDWKQKRKKSYWLWKHLRQDLTDMDVGWVKYWRFQFDKTIQTEKLTWWDYQWIYYQLKHQLLSVVPAKNLVSNIGFNNDGHHTVYDFLPAANLPVFELSPPYQAPAIIAPDYLYEEEYVKKIWLNHKRRPVSFYVKMFFHEKLIRYKADA